MKAPGKRARIAVGVTAALLLLAAVPVVDQILFRVTWAQQALDDIEARHARLLGILEAAPRLQETLARAQGQLARHTYPAEVDTDRVGADIQQRVRRIAESAGLNVVGSQILPARPADSLEVVPVRATLDADVAGLHQFMQALSSEAPTIQVEGLTINASRQRTGAPAGKLRVQVNLAALRVMP